MSSQKMQQLIEFYEEFHDLFDQRHRELMPLFYEKSINTDHVYHALIDDAIQKVIQNFQAQHGERIKIIAQEIERLKKEIADSHSTKKCS